MFYWLYSVDQQVKAPESIAKVQLYVLHKSAQIWEHSAGDVNQLTHFYNCIQNNKHRN